MGKKKATEEETNQPTAGTGPAAGDAGTDSNQPDAGAGTGAESESGTEKSDDAPANGDADAEGNSSSDDEGLITDANLLDELNKEAGDDAEDSAAESSPEPEPLAPVAVLPVKFMNQRFRLVYPFFLTTPADFVIIAGREYAFLGSVFNPHTSRQEFELAELVINTQAEAEALHEAGWVEDSL